MADDIKKDPNDPTQRLSRAEAMAVVRKSAHDLRMRKDVAPEDAKTIDAGVQAAMSETPAAAVDGATGATDPDAEGADLNLDPGAQVGKQTETPLVLSDDDLSKYMVKTKVMGEERMVPLSELRASAQKNEAAEEYLRDAKEQARQILEDAKTAAATQAAAAKATATPEVSTTTAAPPTEVDGLIDSGIDQIFLGNTDEAKRLFKQAVARPAEVKPSVEVNVDQIAATVEQKVVVRSALRQFAKDYPGIYADPIARKVADDFLSEATGGKPLEAFPEEKIGKILHDTGERVIGWTRGLAGVPANGSSATTRDDKVELKKGIDELPVAATRATTVVEQPKTTSDVIHAMKAARGQLRDPTQP